MTMVDPKSQPKAGEKWRLDNSLRRGWSYVAEPDDGRHVPEDVLRVRARDGALLTKRAHGYPARVEVVDESGADLRRATLVRAAAAVGEALERLERDARHPVRVRLGAAGTPIGLETDDDGFTVVTVDGPWVAAAPSHHIVRVAAQRALAAAQVGAAWAPNEARLPERPVRRALFFESLMNAAEDHNRQELSQGVLHMISALSGTGTEVVLAPVKMTIHEQFRDVSPDVSPLVGVESLEAALADGPIGLVCITLLEAYFDKVAWLIAHLRELGCRAHIAVGGVMPTLTPEQVAAHLPDVSFVCRGAGEYFVPELCRVLGDVDVDTPLTDAQRHALLGMRGLIAIDTPGRRLIAADSAHGVQVESLDRVRLDLSFVRADHLVHGLEIAASRGCVHRCSFCTIIGQMTYQARSAEGLFELLDRYEDRFRELYGDAVPARVRRVHIADDDFACDRPRALAFFRRLPETRFTLASCQVSIADLCRHRGKAPLPEADDELLDAMDPRCFFDTQRPISRREFIEDYTERRWSANLQMGVESFDDTELVRHAKGYKVAHIRSVLAATSARGLHVDAYLILSNVDTRAEDLVSSLEEAARLKLRYPVHFHVKYPVTPRLVSIVPSASHRRHVRNGAADALRLRRVARAGHHELDYPFVDHDVPRDAWVDAAVDAPFFTHAARYTGALTALRERWRERLESLPEGPERRRGEYLVRRTDDATRALVFDLLRWAGGGAQQPGEAGEAAREALTTATELLGPSERWLAAFKQDSAPGALVVDVLGALDGRALNLARATRRAERAVRVGPAALTEALAIAGELAVEVRLDGPMNQLPPGSSGWTAALLLAPEGLADTVASASAALDAGATDVRLAVAPGPWPRAALEALTGTLQQLGRLLGTRLRCEPPTVDVVVEPNGDLRVHGRRVGHLDELASPDRYVRDAPAAPRTQAGRILASFLAWHADQGVRAAG